MSSLIISTLTFALLVVGSCSSQPPGPNPSWVLDLKTFGGLAGVGRGNITVNHEGRFDCSYLDRQELKKGPSGTLKPGQLKSISDAVAGLAPNGWNKPGLNFAAPDAFGYKLEFRNGTDKAQVVQWADNTADQLPDDLKKLSDTLLQTMNTSCREKR